MPRKPNYQFDRFERDRQKAAKKAERLAAKQARAAEKRGEAPESQSEDASTADTVARPSDDTTPE